LEWQRHGLGVPDEVKAATEGYREDMDTLRRFIAERCVLEKSARVDGADLWKEYQSWCQENGEFVGTARLLGRRLNEIGIAKGRLAKGNIWIGIGLLSIPQQAELATDDVGNVRSVSENTFTAYVRAHGADPEIDTQRTEHTQKEEKTIEIKDYVNLLSLDGMIQTESPWRIVRIEDGPDGNPYAFFDDAPGGWPLAQCERADTETEG